MAEKVYIDRNTVCEKLNAIGGCGAECDSWADGWDKAIEEAINIANSVPSENVVEVVRCKDCKAYDDDIIGWCNRCGSMRSPNGFCSYGKRKENRND